MSFFAAQFFAMLALAATGLAQRSSYCNDRKLKEEIDRIQTTASFFEEIPLDTIHAMVRATVSDTAVLRMVDSLLGKKPSFEHEGFLTMWYNMVARELVEASRRLLYQIDTSDFILLEHPLYELNAAVIPLKSCKNKKLILFNRQIAIINTHFSELAPYFVYDVINADSTSRIVPTQQDGVDLIDVMTDRDLQLRYFSLCLYVLGVPQTNLPPHSGLNEIVSASVSRGIETFVIAHELAHLLRNHSGKKRGFYHVDGATKKKQHISRDVYSWTQELEADYYGTLLFAEKISHKAGLPDVDVTHAQIDVVKWAPFLLMVLEHLYLKIHSLKGDKPSNWIILQESDTLRSQLIQLGKSPTLKDFKKLVAEVHPLVVSSSNYTHPPLEIRMEVIRYALLNCNLITREEYFSHKTFDKQWTDKISLLYNLTFNDVHKYYHGLLKETK